MGSYHITVRRVPETRYTQYTSRIAIKLRLPIKI